MTKKRPPRPHPPDRRPPARPAVPPTTVPSPVPDPVAEEPPAEPPEVVPPPVAGGPGRAGLPRRRLLVGPGVLLAVALVVAGAVALLVLVRPSFEGADPGAERPPGAGVLSVAPPARLPGAGSFVRTRIGSEGAVEVTQWIRSPRPVKAITVAVPQLPGPARGLVATGVLVAGDRVIVPAPGTLPGQRSRYRFVTPARVIYLHYRLAGAVERRGSVPGRGLVRLAALDVAYRPRQGPTVLSLSGRRVLSVACTPAATTGPSAGTRVAKVSAFHAEPVPCGRQAGDRWEVELRGRHRTDAVMAQVDLH